MNKTEKPAAAASGPGAVTIRKAEKRDFPFILRENEDNVKFLSPMSADALARFSENAELLLVAEIGGEPSAFLIALREGLTFYESENYRWFQSHYGKFLYIDRIVTSDICRGHGVGKRLYQAVFRHAAETGVPVVTAEIDTLPYNEASLKFHKAMGFYEVGTQTIRNGSVTVSLQARDIP